MELMLLPSRAATSRPFLPTTRLRRARLARPAAGPSNVEAIDATAASQSQRPLQERRAGRNGLELDLSEEMRRGMTWRMLAPPVAAVAADAAFVRLLDGAAPGDVPAWAAAAGSAALFAAGLLGAQYGFLSSRWDAAEKGSLVGWDLAVVRHWNVMSMAKEYSSSVQEEEDDEQDDDDDDEEYEDGEDDDEESD